MFSIQPYCLHLLIQSIYQARFEMVWRGSVESPFALTAIATDGDSSEAGRSSGNAGRRN
jgi:hypothetical protein